MQGFKIEKLKFILLAGPLNVQSLTDQSEFILLFHFGFVFQRACPASDRKYTSTRKFALKFPDRNRRNFYCQQIGLKTNSCDNCSCWQWTFILLTPSIQEMAARVSPSTLINRGIPRFCPDFSESNTSFYKKHAFAVKIIAHMNCTHFQLRNVSRLPFNFRYRSNLIVSFRRMEVCQNLTLISIGSRKRH